MTYTWSPTYRTRLSSGASNFNTNVETDTQIHDKQTRIHTETQIHDTQIHDKETHKYTTNRHTNTHRHSHLQRQTLFWLPDW